MGREQESDQHPKTRDQLCNCSLVFPDEERIEYYDRLHSLEEDRYVVLGCVQGILYVVYTMRGEAARLISARMATPKEREIYYGE